MILPILKYGHPMLRKPGARVETVTPEVRAFISDMMETMYDNRGVGLAAQQVGRALQVAVIDVRGVEDRPSWLELNGQRSDVEAFMPLALVNPQLTLGTDMALGPEGCLSFPEVYGDIARAAVVDVVAQDRDGRPIQFRCGGLLGRAIQHEWDHLHGILFIDRMSLDVKSGVRSEIDEIQTETRKQLRR